MNKKKYIFLIFFLKSVIIFSQGICRDDIMEEEKLINRNKIEQYLHYDFSSLWNQEKSTLGIIGENFQRLQIKFIAVVKNENNPKEYFVYGKSKVKNNICDFVGRISIKEIKESVRERHGADNMYEGECKSQGLLVADYEFFENKDQMHTGVFQGILQAKWYLDKKNMINYDDINSVSDGYYNNAFVGTWKMYHSAQTKICNWGDYRIPHIKCGLDCGAAEFFPDEKYAKYGWEGFIKAANGDEKAKEEEKLWWK